LINLLQVRGAFCVLSERFFLIRMHSVFGFPAPYREGEFFPSSDIAEVFN
jgi:hypothetical protein